MRWIALVAFIAACVGGGALSGLATPPGDWYASLAKPSWTPPGWLFGPVWTVLYALMAIAGWRLWSLRSSRALVAFLQQLVLNLAWTPVFFGLRSPGAALCVIVVLLGAIAATIVLAWRVDRVASVLLWPYLAWVAFATALNAAIFLMN